MAGALLPRLLRGVVVDSVGGIDSGSGGAPMRRSTSSDLRLQETGSPRFLSRS